MGLKNEKIHLMSDILIILRDVLKEAPNIYVTKILKAKNMSSPYFEEIYLSVN